MYPKLSDFTMMFSQVNNLDIAKWRFEPGMRHGDTHAWWGQKARRKQIHHGIDFVRYETSNGRIKHLEAGMHVPLPIRGAVVGIIKDFLGHTVIVEHGMKNERLIVGLYGHVNPIDELFGSTLDAGFIFAELAQPGKSQVPPHLHLGIVLTPKKTDFKALSWEYLHVETDIEHIDPLELFDERS